MQKLFSWTKLLEHHHPLTSKPQQAKPRIRTKIDRANLTERLFGMSKICASQWHKKHSSWSIQAEDQHMSKQQCSSSQLIGMFADLSKSPLEACEQMQGLENRQPAG